MDSVKCEKAYAPPPAHEGSRPAVLEVLYISRIEGNVSGGAQPWYGTATREGAWENWVAEWLFPHLHGFLGSRIELRLIKLSYMVDEDKWLSTTGNDGPLLQWSISTLYQLERLHARYLADRQARASNAGASFATMPPRRISILLCHGADAFLGKMLAYTASVQYRDSLRGVIFYAAPHSARSLSSFTEIVRSLLGLRQDSNSETMKLAAACLASLTPVFDELARASGTRVLNFGTAAHHTDIAALRGKGMVSSSLHGEYQQREADFYAMTHFRDRDDLVYLRSLAFIRSVCGDCMQSKMKRKQSTNICEVVAREVEADYTIVLRGYKTLYAAKRRHSTLADWTSLPTRAAADVLLRVEYENLFAALVDALTAVQKARDERLDGLQAALLDPCGAGGVQLHLVGNERQVRVARAVVAHIACVPAPCAALHSHFLDVPCPYDMHYSLPHVAGVERLLEDWRRFSAGSGDAAQAAALREEALRFKARPLRIALVGRSGGGHAAFVNGLLGRRLLPRSTGSHSTVVELRSAAGEEERLRVEYLERAEVNDLQVRTVGDVKQLEQAVEGLEAEVADLGQEEAAEGAALEERLAAARHVLQELRASLRQVNDYLRRLAEGSAGKGVVETPVTGVSLDTLLARVLDEDAVVVAEIAVHVASPLLSQVVLVVPPALDGRTGSAYRDTISATQGCDSWIYLHAAAADAQAAEGDLRKLSGMSAIGSLCVTDADTAADGPSSLPQLKGRLVEELSAFLVNAEHAALVSCSLLDALVCGEADACHRQELADRLLASIVGTSISPLSAGRPSIAHALQDCTSDTVTADVIWKDFALEGSSLLFTLAHSFEMIETGIVVKEFGRLLLKASCFLSRNLYDLCERVEDLSSAVSSLQGAKAGQQARDKKNQLLAKEHSLRTMGEEFALRWQRGMEAFEQQFSLEIAGIYAYVSDEVQAAIVSHKRTTSRKVLKRMLKKTATEVTVSVNLMGPVMERLAAVVEQSLQRYLSSDLDSLLLDKFPQEADLRQSIRSRLGVAGEGEAGGGRATRIPVSSLSCVESTHVIPVSSLESRERCTKPFKEDARRRVEQVLQLGREALAQVLGVVERQVQAKLKEYAERMRQLEEHSRNKAAVASLPVDLLQTRLDVLLREEQQAMHLFARVLLLSIPNAMHSRKGAAKALLLRVDRLSPAEENALSDSMPNHLRERARAPYVGAGVSGELIQEEIFNSFGARLAQVRLEEWIEQPRPILVVESADMFVLRVHTAERWLRCDLAGRQETVSLGTACSILLYPAVRLLFVLVDV